MKQLVVGLVSCGMLMVLFLFQFQEVSAQSAGPADCGGLTQEQFELMKEGFMSIVGAEYIKVTNDAEHIPPDHDFDTFLDPFSLTRDLKILLGNKERLIDSATTCTELSRNIDLVTNGRTSQGDLDESLYLICHDQGSGYDPSADDFKEE